MPPNLKSKSFLFSLNIKYQIYVFSKKKKKKKAKYMLNYAILTQAQITWKPRKQYIKIKNITNKLLSLN